MTDKASASNEKNPIPAPVRTAQAALKTLENEGYDIAELKKMLPGLAMRLNRSGVEVTVELLLRHVREDNMDVAAEFTQKKKTYADVINKVNAKASAKDDSRIFQAAKTGDLETLKSLSDELAEETEGYKKVLMMWAIHGGHFDVMKYLETQHGVGLPFENLLDYAIQSGNLDIVKYLVDEKGEDIHADNEMASRHAAYLGQMHILKYFVEEKGARINHPKGYMLENAVAAGPEMLEYLLEKGASLRRSGASALRVAARTGKLESLKYLAEKNVNIHTYDECGLRWAIRNGHMEVVKYLVEEQEADVTCKNMPIRSAIGNGCMDMLKYLIEKGADIDASDSIALKFAVRFDNAEALLYLLGTGADATHLNQQEKRFVEKALNWQRVARVSAPQYLNDKNPGYYRPKMYQAVLDMFGDEKESRSIAANRRAFAAAGLFGSEERLLQYLEKWGKPGKSPLFDLLEGLQLPADKISSQNLANWADAIVKCGPSMAKYLKYADKVPVPAKSSDGKTWSMANTRALIAKVAYARGKQNPELATLCIEHAVDEKAFNRALYLAKKPPSRKTIPDITINGRSFDMQGAKFYRLPANDVRGLFLGEIVDCCQSIGKVGEVCATSGFKSEHEGFYVIENAKGRIIGETWAWRGQHGELVFDSLETLGKQISDVQWEKLTKSFARALAKKDDIGINALQIGFSGYAGTPKRLQEVFKKAATAALPVGRPSYRDSKQQIVVWEKRGASALCT